MTFKLHVWSPAFSLPSIDPQCIAAIAYLSYLFLHTDTHVTWELVASNDSTISPTKELPVLEDTSTATTIGGLQSIIEHIRTQNPSWDLDRNLDNDPTIAADHIAFTSHILAGGNVLLALSLFVSAENYTATTRPTYSSILPWPTQYIVPPSLRSKARQLTAHLGLSSPDLDDDEEEGRNAADRRNKSIIPDSLRSIGGRQPKTVKEALKLQQASTRFRLEALVDDFCQPLASLLKQKPYLLSSDRASSLDCLASAYLNLMLQATVPQDWLRARIQQRWPALEDYAQRTAALFWGGGRGKKAEIGGANTAKDLLPWQDPPQQTLARTTAFLANHALSLIPLSTSSSTLHSSTTHPPAITPSIDTTSSHLLPPTQRHPQPHTLPTVLLAASAFAAGLAALSTYLVSPHFSSFYSATTAAVAGREGGDERRGRKNLSEMGEAGALLSSLVEVDHGGVGVEEAVDL